MLAYLRKLELDDKYKLVLNARNLVSISNKIANNIKIHNLRTGYTCHTDEEKLDRLSVDTMYSLKYIASVSKLSTNDIIEATKNYAKLLLVNKTNITDRAINASVKCILFQTATLLYLGEISIDIQSDKLHIASNTDISTIYESIKYGSDILEKLGITDITLDAHNTNLADIVVGIPEISHDKIHTVVMFDMYNKYNTYLSGLNKTNISIILDMCPEIEVFSKCFNNVKNYIYTNKSTKYPEYKVLLCELLFTKLAGSFIEKCYIYPKDYINRDKINISKIKILDDDKPDTYTYGNKYYYDKPIEINI